MSLPVSLADAAKRCGLRSALALRTRIAVHGGLQIRRLGRHAYYVLEEDLQSYIASVGVGHMPRDRRVAA